MIKNFNSNNVTNELCLKSRVRIIESCDLDSYCCKDCNGPIAHALQSKQIMFNDSIGVKLRAEVELIIKENNFKENIKLFFNT